jgi:protein-S-isoprenylcysteine O-methyltransferase Ste14
MPYYLWIIVASWAAFLGYWIVSAASAKKSVRTGAWGMGMLARLAILVLVIGFLYVTNSGGAFKDALASIGTATAAAPILGPLGALCSVVGIGIAIWARTYLGRNWGMPMTLRADPELVTSGPYARVRHPIYTGVLLAILGSALASSPVWLVTFVVVAVYFFMSAKREEKDMLARFPDTYPAYKARTKMLIPFVL